MRNIFFGIVIALLIIIGFRYCEHTKDERETLDANTALIEKEIKNVGKLIVTEGSYAQVFTYDDLTKRFGFLDARKKALVVVNANATVAYDLSLVETKVDPETRTVSITGIPEPELSINPNIEYYDVQQNYLNQFEASEYNKIKNRVETELREKIEDSPLMTNANNRLISELQKIYILTNSMGWTLRYMGNPVNGEEKLQSIKL